jgi:pimeloyl-ACP methyl ester carboxylesterase
MEAIALRLSRAARAVDHLLAALSNGTSTDTQRSDTSETAAEAFDRMLLYLCAAMDRYARVIRTLFDATLEPENQRCSLTSIDELRSILRSSSRPTGWRLAIRTPDAITAIISQSGNAYDAGFVAEFWKPIVAYQQQQNLDTEVGVRQYFTLEATRWQYTNGVPDETLVNPESWYHDHALISRPGNDAVQLKLFVDYGSNSPMYPQLHEYFRKSQVPLLAVWGRGDGIFEPEGAKAFAEDLPNAQIHLLDGGHFLLESTLGAVVPLIRDFLGALPLRA